MYRKNIRENNVRIKSKKGKNVSKSNENVEDLTVLIKTDTLVMLL